MDPRWPVDSLFGTCILGVERDERGEPLVGVNAVAVEVDAHFGARAQNVRVLRGALGGESRVDRQNLLRDDA